MSYGETLNANSLAHLRTKVCIVTRMRQDTFQLLKYGFITVGLIAAWFGLASLSHNILLQSLLGCIGLVMIVLYWRWLRRTKLRPPKP